MKSNKKLRIGKLNFYIKSYKMHIYGNKKADLWEFTKSAFVI